MINLLCSDISKAYGRTEMNNRNDRNEDIRSTKIQVAAEKLLLEESLTDEQKAPASSVADQLISTRTHSAKKSSFGHTVGSVLSPIASNNMEKGMNENVENEDPGNNHSDISSNLELNTNFAATTFSTNTRSRNASKICDKFSLVNFHDEPLNNSRNEIENPSNKTSLIASAQSSKCNEHSTSRKKNSNAVLNETHRINSSPNLQQDLIDLDSTELLNYGTEKQNLIELSRSQNVELSKTQNLLQLSADEKIPECSEKLESSVLEKENCITPDDGNHQILVEESVTRKSEGAAEILQGTGARLRDPNSENPEAPEECAQMFNNNATTVSVNHHISNASQIKRRSSESVTFCRSSLLQESLNDKSENTRKSQFEDFTTVTPSGTLSALLLHADVTEDPSKNELGSSPFLQRKSVTLNIPRRSPFTRALWEENQMSETSADSPKNEMTWELLVNAKKDAECILADLSIGDTRKQRSDIRSVCIQSDDNPPTDIQFFAMGTGTQTSFSFSDNVKRRKTETRQSFGMQTTKLPSDFTVERNSLRMQTTKRCSSSPSRRCLKEIGVQNSPWGNQSEPPSKTSRSSYFRDSYKSFGCHTETFPSPAEVERVDAEVFSCPGEVEREVSKATIVPKKIASESGLRNEMSEFLGDKPERGQDDSNSKCDESKGCQPFEKSTRNCNDESRLKLDAFETCTRSLRRNRTARGARSSKNQSVREIGSVESGISSESNCTSSKRCEQVADEETNRLHKSQVCQVDRSRKSDIFKLETDSELEDSELYLDPHKKLPSSTRITPKPKQKPSVSPKQKKRQPAEKQNRFDLDNCPVSIIALTVQRTGKSTYTPARCKVNYIISARHHQIEQRFQYYSRSVSIQTGDIRRITPAENEKMQYLLIKLREMASRYLEKNKSSLDVREECEAYACNVIEQFSKSWKSWPGFLELFVKQRIWRDTGNRRWLRVSVFYGGTNGDVYKEVDGLDLLASYCEHKLLDVTSAACENVQNFMAMVITLINDIKNTNAEALHLMKKN